MLKDLAVHLRVMQMFYQHAHNLAARPTFFSDHDIFSDFYEEVAGQYDGVIERLIGIGGEQDLSLTSILQAVSIKASTLPSLGIKENSIFFQSGLQLEKELCDICQKCDAMYPSIGVKQLVGDICDKAEVRVYKISRRITK